MNFPFQETPEKINEIIGQKIQYLSVLVEKERPMTPLITWIKTADGIWHRFFIDAWMLHWKGYNEFERKKAIEEDFENGSVIINNRIWVVRNIMSEYNLEGEGVSDAQLVYFQEDHHMCAQLQIYVASKLVIYINDYGDEINSKLIVRRIK